MTRHRPNLLTILSLVVCLAACLLWVRSYLPEAIWVRPVQGRLLVVGANGHAIRVIGGTFFASPGGAGAREFLRNLRTIGPPFDWTRQQGGPRMPPTPPTVVLGIELAWAAVEPTGQDKYYVVTLPLIYIIVATAVAPALWAVRRFRGGARGRIGHCPSCGYDIRATPDRCPECGTAATAPA